MAETIVDRLVVWVTSRVDQKALQGSLKTMGAVSAAVSAATVGIALWGVTTAGEIDRVAKTARSLRLTVEEYTALTFAADRSGVSQEQLGAALRSLTMQLGAAGMKSVEAQRLFRALGVEWEGADGKLRTAGEILPEIAQALHDLPSEGQRAALQLRLLGENGAKLESLMEGGAAGIRALTEEAERFNAVVDTETAAASEKFVDNLTNLKSLLGGLARDVYKEVLPVLDRLTLKLTEMLEDSDGIVRSGIDWFLERLGRGFRLLDRPAVQALGTLTLIGGLFAGAQAVLGVPVLGRVAAALLGVGRALVSVTAGALGLVGIPFAPFVAAVAAATAAAGLLYLAWEEVVVTAAGGNSVILRVARALGVGAETSELFRAGLSLLDATLDAAAVSGRLFGDALGWVYDRGSEALGVVASLARYLASFVVPEPVLQLLGYLAGSVDPVEALRATLQAGTASARFTERRLRSDTAAADATRRFYGGDMRGAMAAANEQERQAALAQRALANSPQGLAVRNAFASDAFAGPAGYARGVYGGAREVQQQITVAVQTGASPEEIAAVVSREARRAIEAVDE